MSRLWRIVLVAILAAALPLRAFAMPTALCCHAGASDQAAHAMGDTAMHVSDATAARAKAGIPASLAACHTATIDGYAIEGHVPAAQIKRLLTERPRARGLAVPGMPASAPSMDAAPGVPFDVLLVKADGSTSVFHAHR